MNEKNISWVKFDKDNEPRARWFGFFIRPLRMKSQMAHCLAVPCAITSTPLNLIINNSTFAKPSVTSINMDIPPANNLISGMCISSTFENGSINLSGILLNEESTVFNTPKKQTGLNQIIHFSVADPNASEIPLSKRLAYLLQPPVEYSAVN